MTRGASIRKGEEGVVSGGEQEPELAGAYGAGRSLHNIAMVIGSQQRPLKGEMNQKYSYYKVILYCNMGCRIFFLFFLGGCRILFLILHLGFDSNLVSQS